jgi:hypothetical protein
MKKILVILSHPRITTNRLLQRLCLVTGKGRLRTGGTYPGR